MSVWREDGVFIYPGDVPERGTSQRKIAVEVWFRRFFAQFPAIRFTIQSICVANSFDLLGNNRAAVHWNVQLASREGRAGENSGVTVLEIRGGKAAVAQDFIFDLGESARQHWGAD